MTELDKHHADVGIVVLGDAMANPASLTALIEVCPAPLYRWFHDQRQRVMALALDAIAAGTIEHDQGAILGYLSRITWQDARDAIKGKPVQMRAGEDLGDTAMVGIQAASLLSDAVSARSVGGITYGNPARAAGLLKNLAQRRILLWEIERTAAAIGKVGLGEDYTPTLVSLTDAIRSHSGAATERNLGECLLSAIAEQKSLAKRRAEGKGSPTSWGVPALDKALPMLPGMLIVVSARPGGGKTSLALQAAQATAVEQGRRSVAYLSLEMPDEQLAAILACRELGVPRAAFGRWEDLTGPDRMELEDCASKWGQDSSFWIRDSANGKPTIESVASWIRSQVQRSEGRLRLVVIDYLGLVKSTNPRQMLGERVGEITSTLKQVALAERVTVILLAQMTREGRKPGRATDGKMEQDPEPRVEDLYGGSAIESDADAVLFLHPLKSDPANDWKPVNGIIAKHRHGPAGTVPLVFFGAHQHFQELVPAANERAARLASAPSSDEEVFG